MTRSLQNIALVVTSGTLVSKIGGFARQLVIAGTFGIGAAYDAYSYAYVLPGFFLILLGGINGPFHNAIVTVLSRKTKKEGSYILSAIHTLISTGLILITAILVIAADPLIKILGPGLNTDIHKIAVFQLQIMAPIALLAGLIGIGFGALNANNKFFLPSISPLISSLTLMTFTGIFWLNKGAIYESQQLALIGGLVLALGTLIGALIQWLVQLPTLFKQSLFRVKLIWDWRHPGVKEVLNIIGPATLSSGMLTINVFTDLFFASGIVGAAAGLSYANFLIQAPLGLVSNALIIPLLPTFAKLTNSNEQDLLIARIRQGLMLSAASMIALGAIFITLGTPIVALFYARGAFESNAINLVAALLIAYGIGMPAYLCRDLLVRVFYALGDGQTPFYLSSIGIILNILFDWVLVGGPTPWGDQMPFNFGAPGLVLATAAINFLTCTALLFKLNSCIGRLPLKEWSLDGIKLLIAGFTSGLVAWFMKTAVTWPENGIGLLSQVILSGATSLLVFGLIGSSMKIKEVKELFILLTKGIIRL
ncbi:murein biosynthesis integral membrane protein MurJ [Prochlorococcus sp. MIT 1307]|uniref:murein biosynthesis integral membrane protein MurJ n=1 Tax=Prochlorococcus sp. MIT 1307 TaxID=3096219 RepID=UPI002A74E0CE|nr:murein biosynthesis integral membrane protein MurJ [Prochlorococcus sp. MIT 1307]